MRHLKRVQGVWIATKLNHSKQFTTFREALDYLTE